MRRVRVIPAVARRQQSAALTRDATGRRDGGQLSGAIRTGRRHVDGDSFVGETFGPRKQGATFGYTRVRDYPPLSATRSHTGEVLHIRLRKGSANTSRGFARFLDELLARVERAGATGPRLLRADSGVWNKQTFNRLDRAGWQFSIGVRLQPAVRAAIDAIEATAWI